MQFVLIFLFLRASCPAQCTFVYHLYNFCFYLKRKEKYRAFVFYVHMCLYNNMYSGVFDLDYRCGLAANKWSSLFLQKIVICFDRELIEFELCYGVRNLV